MLFKLNRTVESKSKADRNNNITIIVGLGNPGSEYRNSRHNCGFAAMDIISSRLKNLPPFKTKHKGLISSCRTGNNKIILAYPTTYMNASGECVKELLSYYKLTPDRLIVIYDDIDLPLGALRVRASGGPGTHNGMRSIVRNIGENFCRIRVGVGKPPEKMDLADYVLGKFTPDQLKQMQDTFALAADCALEFTQLGIDKVMAKYNTNKSN